MIIVKTVKRPENMLIVNEKYRFKNPEVIIMTWYGLKVYGANRWYRLIFIDKPLLDTTCFMLNITSTPQRKR